MKYLDRGVKILFLAISVVGDNFTRQRAFDEDDFAIRVGNPTAFLIERLDGDRSGHIPPARYSH
jgi:hypothetical protein